MHTDDDDPYNESAVSAGEIKESSVNIVGGDFVGRDNAVFLGRDMPSQQTINIKGDFKDSVVTIYPNTTVGRVGAQIDRLRGRVTRLIPTEDALIKLAKLREPKPILGWNITDVELSLGIGGFVSLRPIFSKKDENPSDETAIAEKYLYLLGEIEASIVPNIEQEKYSQLLKRLSSITDEINITISRLSSLFTSIVYPATTSRELANNMVTKIGHKEFRDEAKMHGS